MLFLFQRGTASAQSLLASVNLSNINNISAVFYDLLAFIFPFISFQAPADSPAAVTDVPRRL